MICRLQGTIIVKNFSYERLDFIDKYTNEKSFIPTGVVFDYTKTIAKNNEIRELNVLNKTYGNGTWEKKVGKIESDKYIFDVHWYEKEGEQYKVKVKNRKIKR